MAKFTQFCILDLAKPYGLFDTFLSSLLNQFPESIFTARTHCSVGGVEERRLFRAADFPRAFLPRASSCRSCRLSLPKGPAPSSCLHSLSTAPCPCTVFSFFSLLHTELIRAKLLVLIRNRLCDRGVRPEVKRRSRGTRGASGQL